MRHSTASYIIWGPVERGNGKKLYNASQCYNVTEPLPCVTAILRISIRIRCSEPVSRAPKFAVQVSSHYRNIVKKRTDGRLSGPSPPSGL